MFYVASQSLACSSTYAGLGSRRISIITSDDAQSASDSDASEVNVGTSVADSDEESDVLTLFAQLAEKQDAMAKKMEELR